jgi:hypothetical protein
MATDEVKETADFYASKACATSGQMPESQWQLHRKINAFTST